MVGIQFSLMVIALRKRAAGCLDHMAYYTVTVYRDYDKPSWTGIYKICLRGSCGQENASRMWGLGSQPLKVCTLCSLLSTDPILAGV